MHEHIIERTESVVFDEHGSRIPGVEFFMEYEGDGIWKGQIPMDLDEESGNFYTVGPVVVGTLLN